MPAKTEQVGQLLFGVLPVVRQRGDDDDLLGAKSRNLNTHFDLADRERGGDGLIGRFIHPRGTVRPLPNHDMIPGS